MYLPTEYSVDGKAVYSTWYSKAARHEVLAMRKLAMQPCVV